MDILYIVSDYQVCSYEIQNFLVFSHHDRTDVAIVFHVIGFPAVDLACDNLFKSKHMHMRKL